ncbi:MAG: ABC transporter ATP-binding protein, partial [Acetobacteraceae bacterium]|nr:ABC transporter ATP-binding protein [Acetobacteraceae bacterium]
LLDEPAAGVNPTLLQSIMRLIQDLNARGLSFLIVEHNMDLIARLCDPVIVMAEGRTLIEGRFADVAADPTVQEAYMGSRTWA